MSVMCSPLEKVYVECVCYVRSLVYLRGHWGRNDNVYEGHLESSKHGIITPQCLDKRLSNCIFLETRIQQLLDGLIFSKVTRSARATHAKNE